MKKESFNRLLLLIFLISFILRICSVLFITNQPPSHDGESYVQLASLINEGPPFVGQEYSLRRPPLYPIFLSLFFAMGGKNFLLIRIMQALFSSFLPIVIFFIAQLLFDRKTAIYAGCISMVYPSFIYYSGMILTEALFLILFTVACWLLIKGGVKNNNKTIMIGAITLGCAILTRPIGVLSLCIFPLWYFTLRNVSIGKTILRSFLLVSVCLSVIGIWTVRNYIVHERFVLVTSDTGNLFYMSNNPWAGGYGIYDSPNYDKYIEKIKYLEKEYPNEIDRSAVFMEHGIAAIIENPKRYVWLIGDKFVWFWNALPHTCLRDKILCLFSYGILLPFFIMGMVNLLRQPKRETIILPMIIILFTIFHCTFAYGSVRFRMTIEPYIIIIAAYTLSLLVDKTRKSGA